MKGSLRTIWQWIKWPLLVLVVAYLALVIYRVPAVMDMQKTADAVAQIHAQKITLADVMGETAIRLNVDQATYDATVAGIDSNNNGIRDDVEVAIYKKYPNSAKIRAAELQYAMALQLMLTKVTNTETWIAAAEEVSRGDACVGKTTNSDEFKTYLIRTREVKKWVLNTDNRQNAWNKAYDFTTSFGLPNIDICTVDLNTLDN